MATLAEFRKFVGQQLSYREAAVNHLRKNAANCPRAAEAHDIGINLPKTNFSRIMLESAVCCS